MKLSQYNLCAEIRNFVIIFNTMKNSYVSIRKEIYEKLKDSSSISEIKINDEKLYDKLCASNVIIDDDVDEFEKLTEEYLRNIYNKANYDLTLLPTLDCNLRCWYCFEKHIKNSHLLNQTKDNIIKFIENIFDDNRVERLNLSLFGGEPLLYFEEELYPLLLKIKYMAQACNKKVNFLFVTNGVNIKTSNIDLFSELNANFQLSIDGYKTSHDKVKFIPKTKEGTYDHIIGSIQLLTEKANCFVNLRINYDDNTLVHLSELINDIKYVNRKKICIHLERVWQTKPSVIAFSESLKKSINDFLLNDFEVSYMNFRRKSHSCKSSKINQSIISYDGSVYKCTGRDFTEKLVEGFLSEKGTIIWNKERLNKRMQIRTYDNSQCRSCKFLPLCWGPCNQKQIETNGDFLLSYCPLKYMELSLEDYIIYRFNNQYIANKHTNE